MLKQHYLLCVSLCVHFSCLSWDIGLIPTAEDKLPPCGFDGGGSVKGKG